jgi:hypothetical protein
MYGLYGSIGGLFAVAVTMAKCIDVLGDNKVGDYV